MRVKITTSTYNTPSQLLKCTLYSLHGQSLCFHCFIAILKAGRESIDLIPSGMSSHIVNNHVYGFQKSAGLENLKSLINIHLMNSHSL